MPKLNVLVAGSTGYIGVQLVKLLSRHKKVNIKYLCGSSSVGKKISYYDKSLIKKKLSFRELEASSSFSSTRFFSFNSSWVSGSKFLCF